MTFRFFDLFRMTPRPLTSLQLRDEELRARRADRFELGRWRITDAAVKVTDDTEAALAVLRHASGDWGDASWEQHAANERALRTGSEIRSLYTTESGQRLCVVTDGARSETWVFLAGER